MPWIALLLFAGAIALRRITQPNPDDVVRILGGLAALASAVVGLIIAPLLLKSLMLLGLLVYPTCAAQLAQGQRPVCPRFCLFQSQCSPSLQNQFSRRYPKSGQ